MPIYEYICQNCDKKFEFLTFNQDSPECMYCKSKNLEKTMSVFNSSGTDRSSSSNTGSSCSSCTSSNCATCK